MTEHFDQQACPECRIGRRQMIQLPGDALVAKCGSCGYVTVIKGKGSPNGEEEQDED